MKKDDVDREISRLEKNLALRKRCEALIIAMVGKELAPKWWKGPNKAFDGETPDQMFSTDPDRVYAYLINCAHGGW